MQAIEHEFVGMCLYVSVHLYVCTQTCLAMYECTIMVLFYSINFRILLFQEFHIFRISYF